MTPTESDVHAMSDQRRVSTCHDSPTRPVMSMAMAKANGTVKPTIPA